MKVSNRQPQTNSKWDIKTKSVADSSLHNYTVRNIKTKARYKKQATNYGVSDVSLKQLAQN